MTSSMTSAMTGCCPYVLRVKCTHDGNFITASLLCPACRAGVRNVPVTGAPSRLDDAHGDGRASRLTSRTPVPSGCVLARLGKQRWMFSALYG